MVCYEILVEKSRLLDECARISLIGSNLLHISICERKNSMTCITVTLRLRIYSSVELPFSSDLDCKEGKEKNHWSSRHEMKNP